MVLRFLGESVTDSNGLAVLPDGYTGTGAGLVDIVAKTTIDESTVVSNTYEVLDATFYDSGTSSSTATWTNWSTYEPLLVRNTEYCSIKLDTANSKTLARMYRQFDISSNDICIEFDIKHQTNNNGEQFATLRNNSANNRGNMDLNRFGGQLNTWHHIKILINTTNVRVYLDNSTNPYTYNATDVTRFYWDIDTDTSEVDFKNFVIYPV